MFLHGAEKEPMTEVTVEGNVAVCTVLNLTSFFLKLETKMR